MSNASDIAAEVAEGLREAQIETGDGALACCIEVLSEEPDTPWAAGEATATYADLVVIDTSQRIYDQAGGLTGRTVRTLIVGATGAVPAKGQRIVLHTNATQAQAAYNLGSVDLLPWNEIDEVRPLATGGVALMYEVDLVG